MNRAHEILNELIENHGTIGMGSGSTIGNYIPDLKKHIENKNLEARFVPTSKKTEKQLREHGLEVVFDVDEIGIAVDGADQFTTGLEVMKGGGGSLLREKQIGYFSNDLVIIAHSKKQVADFGDVDVPVEINPFLYEMTLKAIGRTTGARMKMRMEEGSLFVTDNGNHIVDCRYDSIENLTGLHNELLNIPGVIETGIFDRHISRIVSFDDDGVEIHE